VRNDESTGFSHVATGDESWFSYRYDPRTVLQNRATKSRQGKYNNYNIRALVTIFFPETKRFVLGILPREEKFNPAHFLTVIAPELSKENSNSKPRVGKKELIVHIENFMCHGRKI
jgi:hypothetical protein